MKHIFGGCTSLLVITLMLFFSKLIDIVMCDFIYGWLSCMSYYYGIEQYDKIFSANEEDS